MEHSSEKGAILGEKSIQDRIGLSPVRLDINKENKSFLVTEDDSFIAPDAGSKRLQIHLFQSAIFSDAESGVSNVKLLTTKKDIHLYTAESLVQSVEKRSLVTIVVVCVSPMKGSRLCLQRVLLVATGGQRQTARDRSHGDDGCPEVTPDHLTEVHEAKS